ncbi:MAG: phage late control D family protein [Paracoccaceae bacterium]
MTDHPRVRPTHVLLADGQPFASDRVLAVEVTDAAGYESDELTITIDDDVPQVERPRQGAVLELSLGYEEEPLTYVGAFTVEEISRSGVERTLTIVAKAADHSGGLKAPRTASYEAQTFGAIVAHVAARHGLRPVVASQVGNILLPYVAQTEESDQHFLTRIGRRLGAVVTPKDGRLVATQRRAGETASGEQLAPVPIGLTDLLSAGAYDVTLKPRNAYGEVRARWSDREGGRTREVVVETPFDGPSMTLREVFQSEAEARQAATARKTDLRSGEGEMALLLIGDPSFFAEQPIDVRGVSLDVDGQWITSSVTHSWDYAAGAGATTTLEAEFGKEDDEE